MKRSRAVRLTLVASASACAGPGAPSQALHCVERGSNRVVADSLCERARVAQNGGRTGAFGGPVTGGPVASSGEFGGPGEASARTAQGVVGSPSFGPSLLWYYGGRVASGFASGGAYRPQDGVAYRSPGGYTSRVGAARGFFGRMAAGVGGGARGAISRGGFGATGAAHAGAHGS